MGFLHKLWDETLAGPTPDSGLGKLRKYDSFSYAVRSNPHDPPHDGGDHHPIPVSRTITILRRSNSSVNSAADSGSLPSSPAGSSTPSSPFSPTTPRGDFKWLTTRRRSTAEPSERRDPISPTVYDWIVINALDR